GSDNPRVADLISAAGGRLLARQVGVEGHADAADEQATVIGDAEAVGFAPDQTVVEHGLQLLQGGAEVVGKVDTELGAEGAEVAPEVADQLVDHALADEVVGAQQQAFA